MTLETNSRNVCDVPIITNRESAFIGTREYAQAIATYNQAIETNPEDVDAFVALAWLLATHRDEHLRDGKRAVKLAHRAQSLASSPSHPALTETLAAAHAEAGEFEEAVYWRTQSLIAPLS
jgi:Flp pilus assembly protein TadD